MIAANECEGKARSQKVRRKSKSDGKRNKGEAREINDGSRIKKERQDIAKASKASKYVDKQLNVRENICPEQGSSTTSMVRADWPRGARFYDVKRRRRANRMASARLESKGL